MTGIRSNEHTGSNFCNRHLANRGHSSDSLPASATSRPSSPFGTYRRRTPSFSDPGQLPPLGRSSTISPFGSPVNIDFSLPSFDEPPPLVPRRRTFSRSSTWPVSVQALPPLPYTQLVTPQPSQLPTAFDAPPRAFTDLLNDVPSRRRTTSRSAPRPYY